MIISMIHLFSSIRLDIFSAAKGCEQTLLFIPTWYTYLNTEPPGDPYYCAPILNGLNDIWFIGLAVVEIMTRFAVYVAIGYIVYAGIKYSNSRGNTEKATSAKFTLQDAMTGLFIAIVASAAVSFIAERLTQG